MRNSRSPPDDIKGLTVGYIYLGGCTKNSVAVMSPAQTYAPPVSSIVSQKHDVSENYEGQYRFAPIEEADVSRAMIKRYDLATPSVISSHHLSKVFQYDVRKGSLRRGHRGRWKCRLILRLASCHHQARGVLSAFKYCKKIS